MYFYSVNAVAVLVPGPQLKDTELIYSPTWLKSDPYTPNINSGVKKKTRRARSSLPSHARY